MSIIVCALIIVSIIIVSCGILAILIEQKEQKEKGSYPLFAGKLEDHTNDDLKDAIKYLKKTNNYIKGDK